MPINGFSVGKDVTLDIIHPLTGGLLTIGNIVSFESRQMTVDRNSHGIDGVNRFLEIPSGWEGSFMLDRENVNFDLFVSILEAAYYQGVATPPATITETITETDGTITQFVYTGAMVKFPELGRWRGDDKVEQRMDFRASKRNQLI